MLSSNIKRSTQVGRMTANMQYEPKSQAYQASVRALDVKLEQLETVQEGKQLNQNWPVSEIGMLRQQC